MNCQVCVELHRKDASPDMENYTKGNTKPPLRRTTALDLVGGERNKICIIIGNAEYTVSQGSTERLASNYSYAC
jgi:hypothetical protein